MYKDLWRSEVLELYYLLTETFMVKWVQNTGCFQLRKKKVTVPPRRLLEQLKWVLDVSPVVIIIWRKFLTELFLQEFYFLFLEILTSKQMIQVSLFSYVKNFCQSNDNNCTEVRFASFFSGGFITAIVGNPPKRRLVKRTSVNWANELFPA